MPPGSQLAPSASALFDCAFYAAKAGLPKDLGLCVEHYIREGAAAGYSPHPLFDPAAYLVDNPDVADGTADPFFHFLRRGVWEGRRPSVPRESSARVSALTIERLTERRISEQARTRGWTREEPSEWVGQTGVVSSSSLGSSYLSHLGSRIADALRADGVIAYRLDQNSERPDAPAFDFVVAPHEFFELGAGRHRWRDLDHTRSILLNTAEPGTASYFVALSYAAPSVVVLDLIPQSAALLHDAGLARSGHLPVGWVSDGGQRANAIQTWQRLVDVRQGFRQERQRRPLDVLFVGTLTGRRRRTLASLAATLSRYRCSIHAPTDQAWDRRGTRRSPSFNQAVQMARDATLVLHLHAGDIPYLDWGWMQTLAVEQGALVVSEPCLVYPGVEPGRHFIAADLENLPDEIDRLLRSAEGRSRRAEVTHYARTELPSQFDLTVELRALAFLVNRGFAHRD